ncbi:MAG: response regulator [Acidobacteria bacterium]|nr:response regulator [Acidobacteriota bacterium]
MKILVADDNKLNLYQLQVLLGSSGYQVVTAANGAEALEKARQRPPDLIVTDILMPVMDGFALCREWMRDERLKHIPLVFYTATYTDSRDTELALDLGAAGFIVKPAEPDKFLQAIRDVLETQERGELRAVRPPVEDTAVQLEQYNEALIRKLEAKMEQLAQVNCNLEREIVERKRAAEEIQDLYDHAPCGYHSLDKDGVFLRVNETELSWLGYSREEMVGKMNIADVLTPAGRDVLQVSFPTLRASGRLRDVEAEMVRKDGTILPVLLNATTVKDASGGFLATRTMLIDLTERRRVELERAHLEKQVEHAQRLESIGKLAGGVAHDFNNLLTVINGYSDLILGRLREGDPLRNMMTEIRKAGGRAAELTRQLLAFSRKQIIQPAPLNLNDLAGEMRSMLQRLIGEDVELVTKLAPDLGQVMADSGQFHQVLMNLAVNARDAMPGGGRLIIETANFDLDEGCAAVHPDMTPGSYVLLAVSDTGTGMDEETRQHIFEPFFTTKGLEKGTGLGLSTVYGIVKQSRGWIWVYSEPGHGTIFKIYLPRLEGALAAGRAAAPAPGTLRGSETVLVVEDEEIVRRLTVEIVRSYGYRVLEAARGGEALLVAERHPEPIHLLLTDVVMPGITGKELADRLKRLRPEMKVLYMSGYTADAIAHQGVLDSGVNYIQKPPVPSALAAKIREVLGPPRA